MDVSTKKIIISIDDFGISQTANERILELLSIPGLIDRVAVMTHGSISPAEIDRLKNSSAALDIHLDASEAIHEQRKLKDGVIKRVLLFLFHYVHGSTSPDNIKSLWEKQIEDFRTLFSRYPDGLNSHQHIHYFPPYFKIFLELAEKHHVSYVRFGARHAHTQSLVNWVLNILRQWDKQYLKRSTAPSADFVVSADWLTGLDFSRLAKKLPANQCMEVIFHPERDEEFSFLKTLQGRSS